VAVNVRIVAELRKNIQTRVNLEEAAAGTNRRRLIQRVVMEELARMLNPDAQVTL
jgi:signal recognition particle subunit SRP54